MSKHVSCVFFLEHMMTKNDHCAIIKQSAQEVGHEPYR